MRLFALILTAALGVAAVTPSDAFAQRRARWYGYSYPTTSYYYPDTYYGSGYYYTPSYSSSYYVAPSVSSSYYVAPNVSGSYYVDPSVGTSYYYPSTSYYNGPTWGQYVPGSGYYLNRAIGGWGVRRLIW
jgi:hypothetical protein